jgi:hypothetical protein
VTTAAVYAVGALVLWFVVATALCWANHRARRNLAAARRRRALPPVPPKVPLVSRITGPYPPPLLPASWLVDVPVESMSAVEIDARFAQIVAEVEQ